jgi:hypothetical protein
VDTQSKILDIAMNLNRVGNWAADDYPAKKQRIRRFLESTTEYIKEIDEIPQHSSFRNTYKSFLKKYPKLKREGLKGPKEPLLWAEEMMTWGNILTHRAKLI